MHDISNILEDMKVVIQRVGELQLKYFRNRNIEINSKSSIVDLVTEVDKKSEDIIIKHIQSQYPGHGILSEESGLFDIVSDYQWVIDPLDGTNNFAHGLPMFSISIALQYKGQTVMGLIYIPVLKELFSSIKGEGAFLNGKPISVSDKPALNQAVIASGFPYDKATHPANNLDYVQRIIPKLRGFRRMGSAAIDLAYTAAGYLNGYWEMSLNPWDVEAGILIVLEAGGRVIHFRDDRNISIIAAGPKIADMLEVEINSVDELNYN